MTEDAPPEWPEKRVRRDPRREALLDLAGQGDDAGECARNDLWLEFGINLRPNQN